MASAESLERSRPFLEYLDRWTLGLRPARLVQVLGDPDRAAVLSVDVVNGFCYEGALASPRVRSIIPPIVRLFAAAWETGVRNILLVQDAHDPQAVEFGQFPPHCVRGTSEAEAVPEFRALPFFGRLTVLEKNSIHAGLNTGLNSWIEAHPRIDVYIVVGDCTDLCTYQLAMHLRLDGNARQLRRRVVVPADCVDTYDMPVEAAAQIGGVPHDGDLLHKVFLYSMMLNGVEVVASII